MANPTIEAIKSETLSEINYLEDEYEIIKNFLKGVVIDLLQVRTTLQSFKDRLSKVRLLTAAYFLMTQKQNFNLQTKPVLDSIDMALVLMEINPQLNMQGARGILQLCLTMSDVKIEDVMSLVSMVKRTAFIEK